MQHPTSTYAHYLSACRSGLRLSVRLGSPRSGDCSSLGICEVFLDRGSDRNCPDLVTAYASIDAHTGRLLLHIDTATLTGSARKRHFPRSGFRVEQAYLFPTPVSEALGLSGTRYRIAVGTYPTLEDDGLIILSLRLTTALYVETRLSRVAA